MDIQFNVTLFHLFVIAVIVAVILLFRIYYKSRKERQRLESVSAELDILKKASEVYKEGLMIFSESDKILFANDAIIRMLGLKQNFNQNELKNATVLKLKSSAEIDVYTLMSRFLDRSKMEDQFSARASLLNGKDEIPVRIFLGSFIIRNKKPMRCYVVAIGDLTTEIALSEFRYKDILTNLPNQNQLMHDMGMMIARMQSQEGKFALMALSLDNFNVLRATLGYQKTDIFISRFSEYLKHITRKLDCSLYQMTRHNFMIMAPDIESGDQVIKIVRQIDRDLNDLLDFSNAQTHLTFSTGVSFFPESGKSINFLIDNAYKALSEAQSKGDGYVIVDSDMSFLKHAQYELSLHNEMHEGLKKHEFVLHYQPIIDLKTDQVIGAEALIRWQHPERGMIAPMDFIPISEKTGFTVELGKFVINEVCKQQKRWEIFNFNAIQISINLSFREIETANISTYIADTVQNHQVDPSLLKFEITENVAMINAETTKHEFESLKQLGAQLALDDFGTGYSSFAYLKEFSLDTLKIDRIFIYDLLRNEEHQTIVKAMIALAHNFSLNVTAEGIEDKEVYELLKEYDCDFAQGYYMSRPLPVFEFQEMIRSDFHKTET